MKEPTKPGARAKADPEEKRKNRTIGLNGYEFLALQQLVVAAGANSTADYLVKRLKLPSTQAQAAKFHPKP